LKITDLFIFKFVFKEEKCKASRAANDLPHRMGRDALSMWERKFVSISSFDFIAYLLFKLI